MQPSRAAAPFAAARQCGCQVTRKKVAMVPRRRLQAEQGPTSVPFPSIRAKNRFPDFQP